MLSKNRILFHKLSATGNDFILIDNREGHLQAQDREFFRHICQRRTGVGADGVLLIEHHREHDFRLRYINADGSETECGNGARSAAYFTHHIGLTGRTTSFQFGEHLYQAEVGEGTVKLKMPKVRDLSQSMGVLQEHDLEEGGSVNTGVPHVVLFGNAIDEIDVVALGRKYRRHAAFQPAGTNVNFVQVLPSNALRVRTYERGVEDETLSCGTGCVASAYLASLQKGLALPVEVQTRGGTLSVHESDEQGRFYLEGEVTLVFEGELHTPKP